MAGKQKGSRPINTVIPWELQMERHLQPFSVSIFKFVPEDGGIHVNHPGIC